MREVSRKQAGVVSPCAACKLLRRRCGQDCVFALYFPADEPQKFANVHKVFGASNVSKLLQELPVQHRSDAVSSLVYEANARVRDPVYGSTGAISSLQRQIDLLRMQLALVQAEMVHLQTRNRQAAYLATAQLSGSPTATATTTTTTTTASSSGAPSPELMELHTSLFDMDLVMDQTNMSELMWSSS